MEKEKRDWVVLKFGGTSVSDARHWRMISQTMRSSDYADSRIVLVHSALSGVSDLLSELARDAAKGRRSSDDKAVKNQHLELAQALGLDGEAFLGSHFEELDRLLASIHLSGEAGPPVLAKVMALGELMATRIGSNWLAADGHQVEWVDARAILESETLPNQSEYTHFLGATCTYERDLALQKRFRQLDGILLTQGFIARDRKGEDVLLGRGGSDTSAAYIASKLGARRLEIWTDVPGILTADPRLVNGARLLKELSYKEAQEIASMGGLVLHPRSIPPARKNGLPICVRSTLHPECAGTRIAPDVVFGAPQVKAVTIRRGTVLISMESLGMWHEVGFLADVFGMFRDLGLSVNLISTSESNLTVTLDADANSLDPKALDHLRQQLEHCCRVQINDRTAVVSLIGTKIRALLHEIGPTLEIFEEHPIYLVSQSSSDLNLSFVVDEDRAPQLANKLHTMLISPNTGALLGPTTDELCQPEAISEEPLSKWWVEKRERLIEIAQSSEAAYVYDTAVVDRKLQSLASLDNLDHGFYAVKANTHRKILDRIHNAGFGFECVSPGEIELVLSSFPDMDRKKILFTPNFAPKEEYADALEMGVQTTIDSLYPLLTWPRLFRGQDLFLRLDPGYRKGHHRHVRTGGKLAKFGIPLSKLDKALELASACEARVIGLHAHVGSGILDPDIWLRVGQAILNVADEISTLRSLNLGGGLGIVERPGDMQIDLAVLDDHLMTLKKMRPGIELWLEPGRFIVAEAGVLVARVTQVKSKANMTYVGVSTGMNSLIRPALYGSYHEIVNLTRLYEQPSKLTTIVGPICESGDRLGVDRLLPPCLEGDIILLATAGAYGAVMSSRYNLREPAIEVTV